MFHHRCLGASESTDSILMSSFQTRESHIEEGGDNIPIATRQYMLKYEDLNDENGEFGLARNRIPGTEENVIFVDRYSNVGFKESKRKGRVLYIKEMLCELLPLINTQRDTTVFRIEDS